MDSYYANGKILMTAEYFVLFGAKALAFPVQYGQKLSVKANSSNILNWEAYSPDGAWFACKYEPESLKIIHTGDIDKASYLQNILLKIKLMKPGLFTEGIDMITHSDFNMNWGLGSSSTLITNLANWAQINPFDLFFAVSNGSGYDIACASASSPVLYERNQNNPIVKKVDYHKSFIDNLCLVYSGKKKATEKHLSKIRYQTKGLKNNVAKATELTDRFCQTKELDDFISLMYEHESLISSFIGIEPVQDRLFAGYKGGIKSLGAWGGDFYLAATHENMDYNLKFFEQFGLSTIIPFKKIMVI